MRHFTALVLTGMLSFQLMAADEPGPAKQKAFNTPEEAFRALLDGMEKNSDEQILDILGHNQKDLVVQSDKEASADMRKKLSGMAREQLKVEVNEEKALATFGYRRWPFPIPVVKNSEGWKFDTEAGKEEILNRRIGRNELKAIQFMDAAVDAQRAYASADQNGDKIQCFAQKLISAKGKKDGLYWPEQVGPKPNVSPLTPFFDDGQDFVEGDGSDIPYNGYYFKVLTKQGANAPNGKYSYVINGHMVAGFALVGWPADHGASGVMTFVVNQYGTVYQKNLGEETAKLAGAMNEYDPDATWKELKDEDR